MVIVNFHSPLNILAQFVIATPPVFVRNRIYSVRSSSLGLSVSKDQRCFGRQFSIWTGVVRQELDWVRPGGQAGAPGRALRQLKSAQMTHVWPCIFMTRLFHFVGGFSAAPIQLSSFLSLSFSLSDLVFNQIFESHFHQIEFAPSCLSSGRGILCSIFCSI